MARLIDADLILDTCQFCVDRFDPSLLTWDKVVKLVADAPTIDAEPVRHGEWNVSTLQNGKMNYCSGCGFGQYITDHRTYRYCPNCGARMDGEKDEID